MSESTFYRIRLALEKSQRELTELQHSLPMHYVGYLVRATEGIERSLQSLHTGACVGQVPKQVLGE